MSETEDSSSNATKTDRTAELRALPAVGAVLARPVVEAAALRHGHAVVARAVREVIAEARRAVVENAGGRTSASVAVSVSDEDVIARAERLSRGTLQPVINATGVIVHTNLGRSPLAAEALDAIREVASGYATLEYDLDEGARGERHGHARDLLVELTGAEDAVVVNNNAGAVLLVLAALAHDKEVIVSRGELVEIGGGFRIPDVLEQSGAHLIEVGTTNRTHRRDYENAIGADTALLLKVHRSNFALVGFTAEVSVRVLSELAHENENKHTVVDAGSGCLTRDLAGEDEPTVASLVADGADIVTFSGDKLLGGPQAGIIVGRTELLERIRRHPLMRALRADKLCLAALLATLRLWRDAPSRIPLMQLASVSASELEKRARRLVEDVPLELRSRIEAIPTIARIGGGTTPLRELASWGLRVSVAGCRMETNEDTLAARLREGSVVVVGRIEDSAVVLDLRCIVPEDDARLLQALVTAMNASSNASSNASTSTLETRNDA